MSLIVDVQAVPNRVYQLVRQRILANRARLLKQRDEQPVRRDSTRPRPQRPRFGARQDRYVRPEPAAVKSENPVFAGLRVVFAVTNDYLAVVSTRAARAYEALIVPPEHDIGLYNSYRYGINKKYAEDNLESDEYQVLSWGLRPFPTLPEPEGTIHDGDGPTAYNNVYYTQWEPLWQIQSQSVHSWTWYTYDFFGNKQTAVTLPGGTPGKLGGTNLGFSIYTSQRELSGRWVILLPVQGQTCIALFVGREVLALSETRRDVSTVATGSIVYNEYGAASVSYYYDTTAIQGSNTLHRSDYLDQEDAYVVSGKKIRKIDVPAQVKTYLRSLYPESKIAFEESTTFTTDPIYSKGYTQPPLVEKGLESMEIITLGYESYFQAAAYPEDFSAYYSVTEATPRTPARSFGIGFFTRANHGSRNSFTPAVFTWLKGGMSLSHTDETLTYAYYRRNYFGDAPSLYIDPSVSDQAAIDFWDLTDQNGITRQTPIKMDEPMPFAAFSQRSKIEYSEADYICWDWGMPGYCRQQLLSLGFKPEDLVP